jgi:hypothetical protein
MANTHFIAKAKLFFICSSKMIMSSSLTPVGELGKGTAAASVVLEVVAVALKESPGAEAEEKKAAQERVPHLARWHGCRLLRVHVPQYEVSSRTR